MNWYTLKIEFKKEFPDWTVKIDPPCISDTRYTHYYYEVLAYALEKRLLTQVVLLKTQSIKLLSFIDESLCKMSIDK